MASLIDCLIEDLTNENDGYEKLLSLSNEKTSAIVSGNIEKLQEIFTREQKLIEEVDVYEKKRQEIENYFKEPFETDGEDVKDICNVLRLPYEEIKVEHIVQILEKKAKEHDALQNIYLKLKRTLSQLTAANENNKLLLKESMDMIQFELDLARNSVLKPQTGNYGRTAYEEQEITGATGFDAKQ